MQTCPWEVEGFEAVDLFTRLLLAGNPRQAWSKICPTSLVQTGSNLIEGAVQVNMTANVMKGLAEERPVLALGQVFCLETCLE